MSPVSKTIAILAVTATTVLVAAGIGTAEPSSLQERLQIGLDETISGADVPGAQLILTEGDKILQINSGVGDLGTKAGFPDNAQVRIASNTKAFVSSVMLQLVGEGKVDLDAPVERYLPGVVQGPGGDGKVITIRNLLQHTSGIPDYLTDLNLESVTALRQAKPIGDLIRIGLDKTKDFEPGARSEYSNTNYLIAGQVIERVTGLPIGVEVTRRVLIPLGLQDTYWPLYPAEQVIRGPHARAYHEFDGNLVDVTDIDAGWGLPDGAMVSTGADLNRFFMALLQGRVIGAAELAQMQRTVPSGDWRRSEDFGLGLFHWTTSCGIEAWGHGGTMHGTFVYGGATAERSVTVSMNELPDILGARQRNIDLDEVVDAALCAAR
ncbi:beta-lactamase family protein [Nocardia sp. NBC_01503]|uniref:serine hydrolase domain-containing protein n=1 Tax=Nocardia sp. NBC_01503 TaxID=2975997 RepID=UPI002E7C4ABC|nr:serine hydrolase domain-containing protein [Nocardia sp. NBC_01503]WTL31848.1 beta-lactamase family protein [Nocardia sp. NBC_01503]